MASTVRDLGSIELWERSLDRSVRRRALAEAARREIGRRRRASVAATAAVAVAPVATALSSSSSAVAASQVAAKPAPPRAADRVLLVLGSTGPQVREVQRALDLVEDGIYGPRTERAVFEFQRAWKLPATGKVDVRTWHALIRYLHSRPAALPSPSPATAEPVVAPQSHVDSASAPEAHAAAKPATEKPAHKRRANAVRHAKPAPRRTVKRHAAEKPAPSHVKPERHAASTAPAASGRTARILGAIASCESGGDPTAVGGGGLYHGLYQFDQQTWESLGGSGDPAAASPAEQTRLAGVLYSQRGTSAWPTCGPAALQTASASHGEQPQRPEPHAAPAPEVHAAAAERQSETSAPSAARPQPQDPAADTAPAPRDVSAPAETDASASTGPSADATSSQSQRVTPARVEPAPSAQQRDESAQSDGATPSPAPTAPRDDQSNDSAVAPEGQSTVPTGPSSGGGDQPSPAEAVDVSEPDPAQVAPPAPGPAAQPNPEPPASVSDVADQPGEPPADGSGAPAGLVDAAPASGTPAAATVDAGQAGSDQAQSP